MGKAEDVFKAREAQRAAEAARETASLFAEIDRLLVGFAGLAERANYLGAERLHRPELGDNVVGWTLHAYVSLDDSVISYVLASTGALFLGSSHGYIRPCVRYTKSRPRSEYQQDVYALRSTVSELKALRKKLEAAVPSPPPVRRAPSLPSPSPTRKPAPRSTSTSFFDLFRSEPKSTKRQPTRKRKR